MRRHLNRTRKCQNKNNMALTEEIIQKVLDGHIYHKPITEHNNNSNSNSNIINATINNYNTLNNFIGNIDT